MSANRWGNFGILSAFFGIAIAIYRHHVYQPVKQGIIPALLDKTPASQDFLTILYLLFGFLAIVFGVVSFVSNESRRNSGTAAGLGLIAIGWNYVLLAVFVAVLVLVISILSEGWSI
jgi:vacuolar-type H+-ATPase subunit I/STV1